MVTDPITGAVTLSRPFGRAKNYVIQFSGLDIENGEDPVASLSDARLTELSTDNQINNLPLFGMAPSQSAFVYEPKDTDQLVVRDLSLGVGLEFEYPLFQYERPQSAVWSPAGVSPGTQNRP